MMAGGALPRESSRQQAQADGAGE